LAFHIIGINPHNERGKMFSINTQGWRPLWHIICNHTPELTQSDREKGHFNDGHQIIGRKHRTVTNTLIKLLREKPRRVEYEAKTDDFGVMFGGVPISQRDPFAFGTYHFSWNNLGWFLRFCQSNEGFRVY